MLKPRSVKRELSLTERVEAGLLPTTEEDVICRTCFNGDVVSWMLDGSCVCCGGAATLPRSILEKTTEYRGVYERELMERHMASKAIINVSEQKALTKFNEGKVKALAAQIATSILVPKDVNKPEERQAMAMILARCQTEMSLNIWTKEVEIYKQGAQYVLNVRYNGWAKILREHDNENDTRHSYGPYEVMSAEDLKEEGALICKTCLGSGLDKKDKKKDCWRCKGKKELDPSLVRGVKVKLYERNTKNMCEQADIPYVPVEGLSIWQVGDTVPNTKSPLWNCKKNARKDCARQVCGANVSIGGLTLQINEEHVEPEIEIIDPDRENLESVVVDSGIQYSDMNDFCSFIQARLDASDLFSDPIEITNIMTDLELEYKSDSEGKLTLQVGGSKMGLYPLTSGGITSHGRVDAILIRIASLDYNIGETPPAEIIEFGNLIAKIKGATQADVDKANEEGRILEWT